jgi:hypothetical protein
VAVTVHCVDADTPLKVVAVRLFDGRDWEGSYASTNIGQLASTVEAHAGRA